MKERYEKPSHVRMLTTDFYENMWNGENRLIKLELGYENNNSGGLFGSFYFNIIYNGFGEEFDDKIIKRYDLSFIVPDDCYVSIILLNSPELLKWTDGILELTTKEEVKSYYRAYDVRKETVIFKAKKKTSGSAKHKFSLNFDILQEKGGYVPISLDPVIINPRPDGFEWNRDKSDGSLRDLDILVE